MSSIQTLQSAMSRTTVMAKAEKVAAEEAKNKKELTFHQKQAAAAAKDPENRAYQNALINGNVQAAGFLATLKYPDHPDHEKNLQIFRNEHSMDPRKTVEAFKEKACKDAGAFAYELRNLAYEQNVLKPYRPTGNITTTAMDFYANMQRAVNQKWEKSGYKGDKAFIEDYANKYGLTRNDTTMDMRNIQPKQ